MILSPQQNLMKAEVEEIAHALYMDGAAFTDAGQIAEAIYTLAAAVIQLTYCIVNKED